MPDRFTVTDDDPQGIVRELARSLTKALDDESLATLAGRLRPFLNGGDAPQDRGGALLTTGQAASAANVHVETIRRAVRAGHLVIAGKVGRSPRIAPEELQRWLGAAAADGGRIRQPAHRRRPAAPPNVYSLRAALSDPKTQRP